MPQNNISFAEQVMRERLDTGWPWRLMTTMFVIFLASLLVYLVLAFAYKPFLNNSVTGLEGELQSFSAQFSTDQKEKFLTFYSQVTNLERLLKNHTSASGSFSLLESLTDKNIVYNTVNLSVADSTLTLDGVARSYKDLVNELAKYESSPEIARVVVDNSRANGSIVQFRVKLVLKSEVFKS